MEENHIINHVIFGGGGGESDYSHIYTTITFEKQIKLILHEL